MFKVCRLSVNISQKLCFRLRKNIHWPIFVSSFSAVYRVSIHGGYPHRSILLFQASRHGQFLHIAFVRVVDRDRGTLVSREPQTRRLCKHSFNFSQCNEYHYAIGGEKVKEMLVFVNVKNTRANSFYRCFTILRTRKCTIVCCGGDSI